MKIMTTMMVAFGKKVPHIDGDVVRYLCVGGRICELGKACGLGMVSRGVRSM